MVIENRPARRAATKPRNQGTRDQKVRVKLAAANREARVLGLMELDGREAALFERETGYSPLEYGAVLNARGPLLGFDGEPVLDQDGKPILRAAPLKDMQIMHWLWLRRQHPVTDDATLLERARTATVDTIVNIDVAEANPTTGGSSS